MEEQAEVQAPQRNGAVIALVVVGIVAVLAVGATWYFVDKDARAEGYTAGRVAGNAAGYQTGYAKGEALGRDEGFQSALDTEKLLAESYQDKLIYTGYPTEAGTWYLFKLKAHKPAEGTANMYSWEVAQSYAMEQGRFELRGDNVYTLSSY